MVNAEIVLPLTGEISNEAGGYCDKNRRPSRCQHDDRVNYSNKYGFTDPCIVTVDC